MLAAKARLGKRVRKARGHDGVTPGREAEKLDVQGSGRRQTRAGVRKCFSDVSGTTYLVTGISKIQPKED